MNQILFLRNLPFPLLAKDWGDSLTNQLAQQWIFFLQNAKSHDGHTLSWVVNVLKATFS